MFTSLLACNLSTITTFSRIVFAGPVELRRWESIKPTLVQHRVFS